MCIVCVVYNVCVDPSEESQSQSQGKEIFIAVIIAAGILTVGFFGAYYFFAPPKPISLDQVAQMRAQKQDQDTQILLQHEQQQTFKTGCGSGLSGAVCRMRQGACGTALGGYLCVLEGREKGGNEDSQ